MKAKPTRFNMNYGEPLDTAAAARFPNVAGLRKEFERESRFGDKYNLSRLSEDGKYVYLPRGVCSLLGTDLRDLGSAINFTSHFKSMKPEQPRVINESVALLRKDTSHILQAPTGFGKTYVGAEIISQIGRRALIVTTKEDIVYQWQEALMNVLGLAKEEVGLWQADRCDKHTPVTVGLVHSILKGPKRYGENAYKGYGLVIFDEVHRMGADTFSRAIWHLPAKLRLGLSATPERKDGKDDIFRSHIGNVRVAATQEVMVPRVLMVRTKWRVPRVFRQGKLVKMPHSAGKMGHVYKMLSKDAARTSLIVGLLTQAYKAGRSTIVFSEHTALLEAVETQLKGQVPEKDIGWYVGLTFYKGPKADKLKQREAATTKPIILATYQMASEATNIPWLDTAILGTPRSDVNQIVGRIRREYPDKKEPVVMDIVDYDSPVMAGYADKRVRWYHSIGAKVKVVN